jgi:hypothetical protein
MSVQPQETGRTLRECDECHEVDDEGHHQVVSPDASGALAVASRHFRCCAATGCPDGSCDAIQRGN